MNRVELKVNHLVKNSSHAEMYHGKNVSYIAQYLNSLGIKEKDIPSFIDRPRDEDEDHPEDLLNMKKACETAWSKLVHGAKVFVVVDSDTDGFTSSSILISYLKRRFPTTDIKYALHPGKEHGIVLEDILEDRDLIFVPDAGSNNIDEQTTLVSQGKTVIILDHHDIETPAETGAIVVNNQFSPYFSNKCISGAGVVYMFIKMMDQLYWPSEAIYTDYRDLAAIGIIADAMNMSTLGNNFLAYYGLRNIKNQFIKEVAIKQAHGIKNPNCLTKIDVAFYIAPIINGVIRSGDPEDKMMVFRAMSEENNNEDFVRTWRGVEYHETIYQCAARLAANAKGRQDANKKKAFEWLCGKVREEGHDTDNIIIATLNEDESKKVSPTLTGLIAMELVKEFNRPALVLRKTEFEGKEVYGGSGRNGNFFGLSDLKGYCRALPVTYAEGHANAFGAFLSLEEVKKLREVANRDLNPDTFENVYEVDYIFKNNWDIDDEMLYQMASYDDLWGSAIPQPKFAFTIEYNKTDVLIMGKDKSSIKIRCNGIDFVAFKKPELAKQLLEITTGTARIVGRPQLNEWNSNFNIQIMVDDIEIEPREAIPQTKTLFDLI